MHAIRTLGDNSSCFLVMLVESRLRQTDRAPVMYMLGSPFAWLVQRSLDGATNGSKKRVFDKAHMHNPVANRAHDGQISVCERVWFSWASVGESNHQLSLSFRGSATCSCGHSVRRKETNIAARIGRRMHPFEA